MPAQMNRSGGGFGGLASAYRPVRPPPPQVSVICDPTLRPGDSETREFCGNFGGRVVVLEVQVRKPPPPPAPPRISQME